MRRNILCLVLLLTLFVLFPMQGMAQRITRSYTNRSMSDVLKDLGKSTKQYKISFIYNELEDFTVTTSFRNLSIPEALGNVFGFYPLKASIEDSLIFVECTQKEPTKLMGKVIDERHAPIEFANVTLLNPQDSSFVTGGVTNASGNFVIPCGLKRVIAKVSCVGYHTLYNIYNVGRVGSLMLRENAVNIKGVVVKAKRPSFRKGNEGMVVDIQHTDFAKLGDALDVLREMPRLNVANTGEITVFGKGTPIVYVNNKQVRDVKELQRLKSEDIKNVEIITAPGAKYDATASAVVRVKTVRKQGEGWSGSLMAKGAYNSVLSGKEQMDLSFHNKGLELFGNLTATSSVLKSDTYMEQQIGRKQNILVNQQIDVFSRNNWTDATLGFSYDIGDKHSLGASYEVFKSLRHKGNAHGEQDIFDSGNEVDVISQTMDYGDNDGPEHEADVYYTGSIGKMKVDFDGSYLWRKVVDTMKETERATQLDSRDIHTRTTSRNQMVAGKLVFSLPVGAGSLDFGGEVTSTQSRGTYVNDENYVDPSSTKVKESNVAAFLSWDYPLGCFTIDGGLRYEYVNSDYYSFGEYQPEPSRTYGNWFPNLSLSWDKGKWNFSLSYACKTSRPSYSNLRNEIQYNNRYMYEGGNPYLRPTVSNDVSLDVVYSWLSFGAEYEYLDNPMMWCGSLYHGKDIALVDYQNFSCKHELSFYVVASPKFGWYNPTLQLYLEKQFLGSAASNVPVNLEKPSLTATLNNRFVFSSSFSGWLQIHGGTYSSENFMRMKPNYSVSVRLVKTFLHDSLKLNLYANDILRSIKDRWTLYGDGVTISKHAYNYAREIGLQISYNFNAVKSKYKGTGAGAAEKNRL